MRRPRSPLALLALALPAAAQTTWHVDSSATPPGDGSALAPYASIQHAIDQPATASGDTLRVAPGTYVENVDFGSKRVTIESTHGPLHTALVPASTSAPTVRAGSGYWCTLVGFTVRDHPSGTALDVPWAQQLRVVECIVRDNLRGLENLYDLDVRRCTIVRNGQGLGHYGGGHGPDAITFVEDTLFWDNGEDLFGLGLDPSANFHMDPWSLLGTDPLFVAPGDWHVGAGSPAVNAGDPGEIDPDGSRRDVGALPYDANWPLGESHCAPTVNSSGGRAIVYLSGSASVSANDLVLAAVRCPANASGIFFYGTERASLPYGDGVLCVGGAIARLDPAPTGPFGAPSFALDLGTLPGHVPPIAAGETRTFSYWFRDVPAGGTGFNYANAVDVTFEP